MQAQMTWVLLSLMLLMEWSNQSDVLHVHYHKLKSSIPCLRKKLWLGLPTLASGRVLHWSLTISAYDISFKYRPGVQLCNADAQSRLPLGKSSVSVPVPVETVHLMNFLAMTPVQSCMIAVYARTVKIFSIGLSYLMMGWCWSF